MAIPTSKLPTKIKMSRNTDQIIRAVGLFYLDPTEDALPPHYFDVTAVVTATLSDSNGNPVTGCNNLVLPYVASSIGDFAGVVEETFKPDKGSGYSLVITAVQAAASRVFEPIDVEVE